MRLAYTITTVEDVDYSPDDVTVEIAYESGKRAAVLKVIDEHGIERTARLDYADMVAFGNGIKAIQGSM